MLSALLVAVPANTPNAIGSNRGRTLSQPVVSYPEDPNGTKFAFNSTLANFDLYTNKTAKIFPNPANGNLTWFSKFNNTTGQPIQGTAFNYTISPGVTAVQTVNWTLTIPKGVSGFTYVKFDWNGNLTAGTEAQYWVFNETKTTPFLM